MYEPSWLPLQLKTADIPANQQPDGLWTLVHPYVKVPAKLKIAAEGSWNYGDPADCGPDGSRKKGFDDKGLNASAPVGALIGKVGGSPADKPTTNAFTFVVGSYAVVVLDDKTEGAVYLTMNDLVDQFDKHSGSMKVTIHQARSG